MFESILEKLLVQNAGMFVDGIDKDNLHLGIWSGSIVIENVRVKNSVIEMLELPLRIKYSNIGRLKLVVPWKSLGSSPVELILEDVFVIISPLSDKQWEPIDFKNVNTRMGLIEAFVNDFTNKIREAQAKQKEAQQDDKKKEDQGYVAKLTEKIIDNIQITIKNIHLRVENLTTNRHYAFGVTLDELQVYTANANWDKQFVDRTDKKNKLQPLRKKLLLKNLGIYWNSGTDHILCDLAHDKATAKMRELVLKGDTSSREELNYLILVSASSQLVQKNLRDPATKDNPNFTVDLNLQPLNLNLQKAQLEDIIKLLEYLNSYNKFKTMCMLKREEEIRHISQEEQVQNVQRFRVLFERMQRSDKKDDAKGEEKIKATLVDPGDVKEFKHLIQVIPDEELATTVKDIVKTVEFERQKKEIEDKKAASSKGGLFGMFKSKPKENATINQEELNQIANFLDSTLKDDGQEDLSEQFASQKTLALNFLLEGGNISLLNQTADKTIEGVTFGYKELRAEIEMRNKGQKVQLSLKEVTLNLKTKYYGAKDFVVTPIMKKLDYSNDKTRPFLSLEYEQDPIGKEDGTYIVLNTQGLEFVYRPVAIQRLVTFFDVSTNDESLKTAAWEQAERAKDSATQAAGSAISATTKAKMSIAVKLASPVIVIPFLQNADIKSACWIMQLGDLVVNSKDAEQDEKIYDIYNINLSGINYKYYPSQEIYVKAQESLVKNGKVELEGADKEEYAQVFNVMDDVKIDLNVKMVNAALKEQGKGKPQMDVNVDISGIHLKLKPQIYNYLVRTGEFLSYSSETAVELQENDRRTLIQGCEKMGRMYFKEKKYTDTVWSSYFVILKGGYIYFFRNPSDIRPSFSLYIKSGKVTHTTQPDRENAFTIERGQNISYLACENPKDADDWVRVIDKKISEYSAASKNAFKKTLEEDVKKPEASTEVDTKKDYFEIAMKANVTLKQLKLTIYRNDTDRLVDFRTNMLSVNLTQRAADMDVLLKLHSLEMRDYLFEYTNPNLKHFLTSEVPESYQGGHSAIENVDLFEVSVKTMTKDHPQYAEHNKTDLDVKLKFGYLFLNLKPDLLEAVLIFLTSNLPKPEAQPKQSAPQLQNNASQPNKAVSSTTSAGADANALAGKVETIYSQTDNILVKLRVDMKQIGVRMVHRKLRICLAEFSLKDSSIDLTLKPQATYFHGKLGNIQLLDTTNYPYTIDSNIEYQKIKPYEILGVGGQNVSLVEIDFKAYEPKSGQGDVQRKVYSFVDINVHSIRINLLQLPLLRIVDFLTSQVLGALAAGNQAQPQVQNAAGEVVPAAGPTITKWQAEETLLNPAFMDINLKVESPVITAKPLPESTEWIEVRLGDITITNERVKNTTRFKNPVKLLDFVYCEVMKIEIHNMGIWKIQNGEKSELTRDFNFMLDMERPLFPEEYKMVYGENYDKFELNVGMVLKAQMTPMIVILSKDDYKLMMKILSHNVSYNDGLDSLFAWVPPKTEVPEIKKEEVVSVKPAATTTTPAETKASPISFSLKIQNIGLVILEEKTGLPITMINIHLLQVNFESDEYQNMDVKLLTHDINGSMFERAEGENVLLQKNLIGSLARETKHEILPKSVDTVSKIVDHVEKFTAELLKKELESKEFQLQLLFQQNPKGDKNVSIELTEFRCYLITSTFLSLANFAALDDSVNAPPPKTELQNIHPIEAEQQKPTEVVAKPATQEAAAPAGDLNVRIAIKNIVVSMPSTIEKGDVNPQALSLRGNINLAMQTFQTPSLKDAQLAWSNKKWNNISEQAKQDNRSMKIILTLNSFELFISQLEDLLNTEDFNKVRKRNLIMPFSLLLLRESFMILNSNKTKLITYNKTTVTLEKFMLRVSYSDFKLLFASLNYQLEQLAANAAENKPQQAVEGEITTEKKPAVTKEEEIATTKTETNDKVIPIEESKETKESKKEAEDFVDADFDDFIVANQGIQLSLINDSQNVLVPVLEFAISEMGVGVLMMAHKLELKGKLSFTCSYYNPRSSHWEPIIERYGLDYEICTGERLNPKTSVLLRTSEEFSDLNINVSDQMIETLYSTTAAWKADYEETKQIMKSKKDTKAIMKGEDNIEYVSPYNIKNSTGYKVEISGDHVWHEESKSDDHHHGKGASKHKAGGVYTCENGASVSYLLELDVDQLFKQAYGDYHLHAHKIKVGIHHESLKLDTIKGIDIDSNLSSKHLLQTGSGPFEIVTQTNFVDNKRVLSICSPIQIRNCLSTPLHLRLEHGNRKVELVVGVKEEAAVPFDFINKGYLTVLNPDNTQLSGPRNEIVSYTKIDKKLNQITVGDRNYIVKPVIDNDVTYIEFKSPFVIKNCCPLPIYYQIFSPGTKVLSKKLKSQETAEIFNLSRGTKAFIKTRVQGLGWSSDSLVYSESGSAVPDKIAIKGIEGTTLTLNVHTVQEDHGSYKIYLYTKAMIVNETLYDLIYYSCDEDKKEVKKTLLPGLNPLSPEEDFNPKITFYGDSKKLAIATKKAPKLTSTPFAVGAIGDQTTMIEDLTSNTAIELGINLSLVTADKENYLFTNVITILPRYVLVNKLKDRICIKRPDQQESNYVLEPGVRTPFEWHNYNAKQKENKQVNIRVIDQEDKEKWTWTGAIDLSAIGTINLLARSADKSESKFLKIKATTYTCSIYVEFEEQAPEETSLRVQNDLEELDIVFFQTCVKAGEGFTVPKHGSLPYAWHNPYRTREIYVDFHYGSEVIHDTSNKFSFDAINKTIETVVPIPNEERTITIHTRVQIQGNTRILRFYKDTDAKNKKKADEVALMSLQLKLTGIGFSLISSIPKIKSEVIYASIKGIEVAMLTTNLTQAVQLRVKYVNIDNNSYIGTMFPVFLTPSNPKDLLNPASKSFFIDIAILQNLESKEIPYYNYVKVLLSGICLRVDGTFLEGVLGFLTQISDIFAKYAPANGEGGFAQILMAPGHDDQKEKLKDKQYFEDKLSWKSVEIVETQGNLFIEQLQIQPLFLNLSFKLKGQSGKNDGGFFVFNILTNVLGSALANVDEAPLSLSGVQLANVFDEQQDIIGRLVKKYTDEGIKQVYKILGSIDILGNPVGLFNNISTGVVDLFEKPMHGFNQGPLEGGVGIVLGAGSLLKNTVSGTFNSLNKVTGSLAGGLSSLTMDDEYIAQREKAKMNRPKNLVEGFGQGFKSLGTGVFRGITGVVTKPFQGARKDGVKGFFKGTWQGVSGLVVKPVTGVLDAASKASEGIKNTATMFDEKPNQNRQRFPRPFYGVEQFYRTYLSSDAEVLYLLQLYNDGEFAEISLLYTFDVFPNQKDKDDYYVLVLAAEVIIYWSSKKGKVMWYALPQDIEKTALDKEGVIIYLRKPLKSGEKIVSIGNPSLAENKLIVQKLNQLISQYAPAK